MGLPGGPRHRPSEVTPRRAGDRGLHRAQPGRVGAGPGGRRRGRTRREVHPAVAPHLRACSGSSASTVAGRRGSVQRARSAGCGDRGRAVARADGAGGAGPPPVVRAARRANVSQACEGALAEAGLEPLLPLRGRAVGPGLRVDLARVFCWIRSSPTASAASIASVDVLVGEVEDQRLAVGVLGGRGVLGPHAGVAVGLQLEAYGVALRSLLGPDLAHGAEQVLDVVAVLVGEHVGLHEPAVGAAELLLEHLVEERRCRGRSTSSAGQ